MTSVLRWLFTNRRTGRITIAQWPNAPLWVWIAATLLDLVGVHERWIDLAGTAGLAVWAALEVWSGVNPWRRLLGLGGLLSVASTVLA